MRTGVASNDMNSECQLESVRLSVSRSPAHKRKVAGEGYVGEDRGLAA